MKRVVTILMMTFCFWDYSWAGYVDHRGHNVDSLETVIAKWTAKDDVSSFHVVDHLPDFLRSEVSNTSVIDYWSLFDGNQ